MGHLSQISLVHHATYRFPKCQEANCMDIAYVACISTGTHGTYRAMRLKQRNDRAASSARNDSLFLLVRDDDLQDHALISVQYFQGFSRLVEGEAVRNQPGRIDQPVGQ
jgi:hypothetical protein